MYMSIAEPHAIEYLLDLQTPTGPYSIFSIVHVDVLISSDQSGAVRP